MNSSNSVKALIEATANAANADGFQVTTYGTVDNFPLIGLSRPALSANAPALYLSSGIHGDEPAGPLAILQLLQSKAFPRNAHLFVCPMLNPGGMSRKTRENAHGIDLNRDYRDFQSDEIQAHRQWIRATLPEGLGLCLHLHEDWESKGFYLYELNFTDHYGYSALALQAASQHLPIDLSSEIDGHPASGGIIRPDTVPEVKEGLPEAIYFNQRFGGLNYTLETPSTCNLTDRINAQYDCTKQLLNQAAFH